MHTVSQRILSFNKNRLPEMVQLKYGFMAENMFRFYRGTCHLFYEDLKEATDLPPSPLAWICGDLHLENFGSYKSDNRLVYFDMNDFDEGLLAPASLELARIVTSIFVAFGSLQIPLKEATRMASLFLQVYSNTLAKGKARYIEPQVAQGIVHNFLDTVSKRNTKELLNKYGVQKNLETLLKRDARHFNLDKALEKELFQHITDWIANNKEGHHHYKVKDVVFRIAGTGSVGVPRYLFLLQRTKGNRKYILMDMKRAAPSAVLPYIQTPQPQWTSEAERVIAIQQRMQNIPPALLSTSVFKEQSFSIREMQPAKDSIDFNLIKNRYRDIEQVIQDMALLTASAQLRSSGRQGAGVADELIAFGENKQWQKPVLQYTAAYAKQVKKDFTAWQQDYNKGLLP